MVNFKTKTPEYRHWLQMKRRCNDKSHVSYPTYGAMGVKVCQEWETSFEAFLSEVGARPTPRHTIDRIKNELGYQPGNVRWATKKEQSNNRRDCRRVTFQGETKTLMEWSRKLGISYSVLQYRLDKGWGVKEALTQQVKPKAPIKHDGKELLLSEWATLYKIDPLVLLKRLQRGWPMEKALAPRDPRLGNSGAVIEYRGEVMTVAMWAEKLGVPRSLLRNRFDAGWTPERILTTPKLR